VGLGDGSQRTWKRRIFTHPKLLFLLFQVKSEPSPFLHSIQEFAKRIPKEQNIFMKISMILEKRRAPSENIFRKELSDEVREGLRGSEKEVELLLALAGPLPQTLLRLLLSLSERIRSFLVLLHGHTVALGHHFLVRLASLSRAVVAVNSSAGWTSHTTISPFEVLFSAAPYGRGYRIG
jgi:hypothetical protein